MGNEKAVSAEPDELPADLVRKVTRILEEADVPPLIADHIAGILELNEQGLICGLCGCTEEQACFDDVTKQGCHWVKPGLCSVCAREERAMADQVLKAMILDERSNS
jgi:hypothetical protein